MKEMRCRILTVLTGAIFALSLPAAAVWNISELMRPKNGAHPMNWTPLVLLFFLAAACFTAVTVYRIEKNSDR